MKIFQTAIVGLLATLSTTSAFTMTPSGQRASTVSLRMSDDAPAVEEAPAAPAEKERHQVYVGNLPFSSTPTQIRDLFAEADVAAVDVSMPMNPNMYDEETGDQMSKGFCFVEVDSAEAIEKAVEALSGKDLGGRSMRVNKLVPKEEMEQKAPRQRNFTPDGMKKMYVGNLPFDATTEEIKEHFESMGSVSDLYVPQRDGQSRGFAFVTMETSCADNAIEELNGAEFQGRRLVVNEPRAKGENGPRREKQFKLYVGNLSFYTTQETLQGVFEEFGDVYDCYLPTDPNSDQPRGFGFITMSQADGEAAIAELDGLELDGRFIRVNEAQGKKRAAPPPQYEDDDSLEDW